MTLFPTPAGTYGYRFRHEEAHDWLATLQVTEGGHRGGRTRDDMRRSARERFAVALWGFSLKWRTRPPHSDEA